MKKKYIVLFSIVFILLIILLSCIIYNKNIDSKLKYSQEYIVGQGNIKGNVNIEYFESINSDFEIGANSYGYAVFKNPDKAFKRLLEDYQDGIHLIQKEFSLKELSNANYELYGTYGWQVTTGTEEEQSHAHFVSSFIDIYENSFKK